MTNNDVILEKLKGIERLFNEKFEQNNKDHKTLIKSLEKKANKWVEKVLWIGMIGALGWLGGALLDLIPKAYALVVYHITLS